MMEIRVYLRIIQKRWWMVLGIFVVTLAATSYFTWNINPVYEAKSTYIVRLSPFAEERNVISALNTLTSRTEIASTYAGVANSSLIRDRAAAVLGIDRPGRFNVKSQIRGGTNILEITVEGNDPALVRDFTNAVGLQTVSYVEQLYETYRLESLDPAVLPVSPIRPNVSQNLVLGGILGLMLGIGLVIFMEYLRISSGAGAIYNILDERIGIYDLRYFKERLHQEMSRVRRHRGLLSLALVNIDHRRLLESASPETRLDAMRTAVLALGKSLRDEDVMATFSETELVLLLPELDGEHARTAIERVLAIINKVGVELGMSGRNLNLNGAAGVAPFHSGDMANTDALIARARNALDSMRESTYGKVVVSTEGRDGSETEIWQTNVEELEESMSTQEQPDLPEKQEVIATETQTAEVSEPGNTSQEQMQMAAADEPAGQDHNGKKSPDQKAKRNENRQTRLELSEQES